MSAYTYLYSLVQCVPCLSRNERINIGVLLLLPETHQFKLLCAQQPPVSLQLICPELPDYTRLITQLAEDGAALCEAGDSEACVMAFQDLIKPRSQLLQFSTQRTGRSTDSPELLINTLFTRMVTP